MSVIAARASALLQARVWVCDTQRDFEIVFVILSTAKNPYLLEKRVLRRACGLLRTTEELGRPILLSVILSTAKNPYLLEKRVLRRAYGLLRTTEEWGKPILLSVILSERSESKNPLPCAESGRAADGQWPPLHCAS